MLNTVENAAFGILNSGLRLVSRSYSVLLLIYMAGFQGVNALLTGLVYFLALMGASLLLPYFRIFFDRENRKFFLSYHFVIMASVFLTAIAAIPVWTIGFNAHGAVKLVAMFFAVICFELTYGVADTVGALIGREFSGDAYEHSFMKNYSVIADFAGCAALALLFGAVFLLVEDRLAAFEMIAYTASSALLIFGAAFFFLTFSHFPRLRAKIYRKKFLEKASFAAVFIGFFKMIWKKKLRMLTISSALIHAGIYTLLAAFLFISCFFMRVSYPVAAGMLILMFAFAAGAVPFVRRVTDKIGRKYLLESNMIVLQITLLLMLIISVICMSAGIPTVFTVVMYCLCPVFGICLSAATVLPKEYISSHYTESGEMITEQNGRLLNTSAAFSLNAGRAAGVLLAGLSLTMFGFDRRPDTLLAGLGGTVFAILFSIACFTGALVIYITLRKTGGYLKGEDIEEDVKAENAAVEDIPLENTPQEEMSEEKIQTEDILTEDIQPEDEPPAVQESPEQEQPAEPLKEEQEILPDIRDGGGEEDEDDEEEDEDGEDENEDDEDEDDDDEDE